MEAEQLKLPPLSRNQSLAIILVCFYFLLRSQWKAQVPYSYGLRTEYRHTDTGYRYPDDFQPGPLGKLRESSCAWYTIGHWPPKKKTTRNRVARRRQDARSTFHQRSSGGRPTIPFIHYGAGITVNKLRSLSVPLAPRGLPVVNGRRDWAVWTSFLWGWV